MPGALPRQAAGPLLPGGRTRGLMVCTATLWKRSSACDPGAAASLPMAAASVRHAVLLPLPVLPTIMLPWRAT